ncbi:MAG TPA: N-acetylmuramoyl-L-alanine amidase [Lacipirellulaceae bacterium]|nr:N-acetylmuramoyl-L-alanine amidase [Lacipirellulaceae bacterium]
MTDWLARAKRTLLRQSLWTSVNQCGGRPSISRRRCAFEELEPRLALSVAPGLVAAPQTYSGALDGKVVFVSGGHGIGWNGSAFATERPDYWEANGDTSDGDLVEDFGNQDQMSIYADDALRAGATVVPMRPVGHQLNEVVLDNDSPDVSFTGSWSNSANTRFYDEDYGATADAVPYKFAGTTTGPATAFATYTPNIPEAGFYPVYTWVHWGTDRTVQTYTINHTGGSTEVKVDHSVVGDGWVYLGTYHFDAGKSTDEGSVVISNQAPLNGRVVIADAIRFGNGMGDYIESGAPGVSGAPREDEDSFHWIARSIGQGTTISSVLGSDTNVSAPSDFAEYMYHGNFGGALYIGFHSNGSTGAPTSTGRGARGLYDNSSSQRTPNQVALATLMGDQVNQDFQNLNGVFEYDWTTDTTNTDSHINFGEINLGQNAEMDATIVEVAYHDNLEDNALLRDPKVRDQIARSVYQGTVQYFATYGSPAVTNTSMPTTPTNVRAVSSASGQVTISWSAGPTSPASVYGDPATGYVVYASVDGYGFDGGTVVSGGGASSVTLSGYDPNTPYYFKVAATNAGGESEASEVVAALPSGGSKQVLIVNGFDRIDRTQDFFYPYTQDGYSTPDPDGFTNRVWPTYNNSHNYVIQVASAIEAAKPGVHFESTSNEAVINGAVNLNDYDTVIWILGDESSHDHTFDATEQTKLASFINTGGNLFVSGSEIGWDLDHLNNGRSFYENTLQTNYVADDANTYAVTANAGGIFGGMSGFAFSNGSSFSQLDGQMYNVDFPDVIAPQAGAASALTYSGGTGGTAAIQAQGAGGKGSIVMFGFPFETITGAASRQEAMGRILDFFGVSVQPNADFNGDSHIDAADYVLWRKNSGLVSGATQVQGDANDDGAVNSTDYDVWRAEFGTSFGAGSGFNSPSEGATELLATADSAGSAVDTTPSSLTTTPESTLAQDDAVMQIGDGLTEQQPRVAAKTASFRNAIAESQDAWQSLLVLLAGDHNTAKHSAFKAEKQLDSQAHEYPDGGKVDAPFADGPEWKREALGL